MRAKRGEPMRWLLAALAQETDECLLWPYSVQSSDYGDFKVRGEHWLVHRWVCTQAHGAAPDGHDAAHSCGTRLCGNKRHLSWKTRADNLEDRRAHGTMPEGANHSSAILTEEQVRACRAAPRTRGVGVALAGQFGCSPNTVYAARGGRSWKCL